MCIAILIDKFHEIEEETLKICNSTNPDGMGFAFFNEKNELVLVKEADQKKIPKLIKKFLEIRKKFIYRPMLLHFRIATHGRISNKCCHPFKINNDAVFCHNGILRHEYGVTRTSELSDTMMFNKQVLQQLKDEDLMAAIDGRYPVLKTLLEEYIGPSNKVIMLNKNDNFLILNEKVGVWDKGIWYSNNNYKKKTYWESDNYWNWNGWKWQNNKNTGNKNKKWYEDDDDIIDGYCGSYNGYYGYSNTNKNKKEKISDEHNDELLFSEKRHSKIKLIK